MGMKNALCCFLLLVLVSGACFHLPFVAFCCSSLLFLVYEIESIQMPFVARYGFLGRRQANLCFHFAGSGENLPDITKSRDTSMDNKKQNSFLFTSCHFTLR